VRAPSRFDSHASLTARAVPTRSVANGGHGAQSAPLPTLRFTSSGTRCSAYLAHEGLGKAAAHEASVLKAIWIAPDAVLALTAGFQEFGLQTKALQKVSTSLGQDKLWRVPPGLLPKKSFIVFRRLTEEQLGHLRTRRAPKKYLPTTGAC
jgi:hypothetical protein